MHAPSRWPCLLMSLSSLVLACGDAKTGDEHLDTIAADSTDATDPIDTIEVDARDDTNDDANDVDVNDEVVTACVVHAECDRDAGLYCLEGHCQASGDFSIGVLPSELASMGMVGEASSAPATVFLMMAKHQLSGW